MTTVDPLADHLERFIRDVIADALISAQAQNWKRRAHDFEAALPRDGDFLGRSGADGAARVHARLGARALACLARAELLSADEDVVA